jgi:hypothetical protein
MMILTYCYQEFAPIKICDRLLTLESDLFQILTNFLESSPWNICLAEIFLLASTVQAHQSKLFSAKRVFGGGCPSLKYGVKIASDDGDMRPLLS